VIPADTPTPVQEAIPEAGKSTSVSCQRLTIVEAIGLVPDNLRTHASGFEDPRFNWKAITDGNYTVHYYGDIELAAAVISGTREGSDRLKFFVATFTRSPVDIFLYENSADLTKVLPATYPRLDGIDYLGAALVDERVLLVSGGVTLDVASTTVYELTELIVRETSGSTIPNWLVDGLAAYTSCHGDEYPAALRYGIFTKRIMPLGYKPDSADGRLIQVGQSLSVVEFLISNYGEDRMARLLEAIKARGDIDLALEQAYGLSQSDLDHKWRLSVGLDPLPVTPATDKPTPRPTYTSPPTPRPASMDRPEKDESLSGTIWQLRNYGTSLEDVILELHTDGRVNKSNLDYQSWEQYGDTFYYYINDKFATYVGAVSEDRDYISGTASNDARNSWTWEAFRISNSSNPTPRHTPTTS